MAENNIDIVKQHLSHIKHTLHTKGYDSYRMIDVLLLFIFIRRMECLFAPVKSNVQKIYKEYKDDLDYDDMDRKIHSIIGNLGFYTISEDNMESLLKQGYLDTVAGFEHYFHTYDHETLESIEQYGSYSILGDLVYRKLLVYVADIFCKIDLSSSVSDHDFIELINELFCEKMTKGLYGEFYTSWEFSRLMSMLLFNGKPLTKTPSVYDPACGSTKLLRDVETLLKAKGIKPEIYGQDIMSSVVATSNLIANCLQQSNQHILSGDTLLDDRFEEKTFDYIISDLPVNMPWRDEITWLHKGRFMGYPSKDDSTLLFVQHIINKMNKDGRAIFTCLPKVFMNADGGSDQIRSWLIGKDILETIIILPAGFIASANVPFCVCVLDNNKSTERKGNVQIIDCNTLWTQKKNGKVHVMSSSLQQLYDYYASQEGMVSNDSFFQYRMNILQPTRQKDGSLKYNKDGKMVADKKKTLSVTVPITEKDIVGYVRRNYLNHADKDAWVDASSITKLCFINLQKSEAQTEGALSLVELESSANEIRSQIQHLFDDIFAVPEYKIVSESIPARKNVCMLNALVRTVRQAGKMKNEVFNTEGEYPALTVEYLRGDGKDINLLYPENPSKYVQVEEGDPLIIMTGANAGEILQGKKGCLSGTLAKFEIISDSITAPYIYFLLKAKEQQIRNTAKGIAQKSITLRDLSSLSVEIPSLDEQKRIVEQLSDKVNSIDKLLPMLGGKAKQTMQEYRQALIIDAVLGGK